MIKKEKNKYGQYFTKKLLLKKKVYELIKNKPIEILEPSVGRGDLVDYILTKNNNIKFDMYEIDKNIEPLNSIKKNEITYIDFLKCNISKKYKTIIGNPPYIRTKTGNLYIDFISKCYDLLLDKGELIFIVPSDFIKLTSASIIINKMMNNGSFTHIIFPNDEKLFENANIDVIIFRYCKNNKLNNKIYINGKINYLSNSNGILTYSITNNINNDTFSNYFDIYVGMVSGKEDIFKNDIYGNIKILNGENKIDKYILIDKFPSENIELNNYLLNNKQILINRKIRKFNETNWYEWGTLRNFNSIKNNLNKPCIYINTLTRKDKVCFKGKTQLFGGQLIIMIPKFDNININNIVKYINSDKFKQNYTYSGRFKIGYKQLSNALFNIPTN